MSEWSDEQAEGAALEFIPGRVDGGEFWPWSIKQRLRELLDGKDEYSVNVAFARGCTHAVGRAILDLRERAEKAEWERDNALAVNARLVEDAKKAEQRCAALEAALNALMAATDERIDMPMGEKQALLLEAHIRSQAALSGDTSALREMLERAAMRGAIAGVSASTYHSDGSATLNENTVRPVIEAIAKRVMEGK